MKVSVTDFATAIEFFLNEGFDIDESCKKAMAAHPIFYNAWCKEVLRTDEKFVVDPASLAHVDIPLPRMRK